jgi:hypothetical protein
VVGGYIKKVFARFLLHENSPERPFNSSWFAEDALLSAVLIKIRTG